MTSILRKTFFNFIFIFIIYLLYVFPYEVFVYLIFKEKNIHFSSILFSIFIYFLMNLYFKFKKNFFIIRILIYEGMGVGFLSFWVALIGIIVHNIFNVDSVFTGMISLIILTFLIIKSLLSGIIIKNKKISFLSNKLKKKLNLIFISDVHLGSNDKGHLKKILSKIDQNKIDMLLIGGDLIDSSNFNIKHLTILKEFKKPIFYVSGNHENYLDNWASTEKSLKNFNIIHLNNKSIKTHGINIIGVDDNLMIHEQKSVIEEKFKKDLFNLVIVHKPSVWKGSYEYSDLMLSGHTHNGQIFPFNFFVKFRFKHLYGIYKKMSSNLYVSSGVGCWGPKMRLGSSNEIVEISIISTI